MKNLVCLLCKTSLITALAVLPMSARADLTWGSNGAGGTGTWNDANTNWWNGSSDVVWDSTRAIFAGTAGTVTVSGTQAATGLSFSTGGYTLTGGAISFANTGTITTTPVGLISINSTLIGSNGLYLAGGDTSRTFAIGGNNTGLTGPITLASGILRLTNSNGLGTNASDALTVAGGTVIQLASGVTLNKNINTTGSGNLGITAYTGNSVMTGAWTTSLSPVFQMDVTNTLTLSGDAGFGRTGSTVQVVGTGTMIINTSAAGNTAYGLLLRGSATLQLNNVANQLGNTNITMGDSVFGLTGTTSPTIALNGATLTNATFLYAATTNRIVSNIAAGGTSTVSGQLNFQSNTDLTLASRTADGKLVVSGVITEGGGFDGRVKVGTAFYANSGTVEFSRAAGNTYDGGTEINSGTLLVSNSTGSATGTGAVDVNSGGTLAGNGFISGAVNVNSGGTISGGATVGILSTGNLSLASGSFLSVQINSLTAGTGYDQINVTGSVTLGGNLAITLGFTPVEDDLFFIVLNDGGEAVTGLLGGHAQGDVFALGGGFWRLSYEGNSATNSFTGGNDVVLQAVPEPSSVALIALAAAAGFYGVRRKVRSPKA